MESESESELWWLESESELWWVQSESDNDSDSTHLCKPNINSGSMPQEAHSNTPLITVSKSTHKLRNTAVWDWLYLLRVESLCILHPNVFNTGMPVSLIQQWPSTAGLLQCTQQRDCGTDWSNLAQLSQLRSDFFLFNKIWNLVEFCVCFSHKKRFKTYYATKVKNTSVHFFICMSSMCVQLVTACGFTLVSALKSKMATISSETKCGKKLFCFFLHTFSYWS